MTEDLKIRQSWPLPPTGSGPNVARDLSRLQRPGTATGRPEAREIPGRNAAVSPLSVSDETRALAPPLTLTLFFKNAVADFYRLRRLTCATSRSTSGLRYNENIADVRLVSYQLRSFTRARPCRLSWLGIYQNDRDALSVPYRLRRLTRATRAAHLIAARQNEIEGNSLSVPYRLRRFTRAGFWCAMHVSEAGNFRFSLEILINGPAIRIPGNHLKTIIRDHLRSTVEGGYEASTPKADAGSPAIPHSLALLALRHEGRRARPDEESLVTAFLIYGSAIRIPRNHLKTIIGDQLRSTVKEGHEARTSKADAESLATHHPSPVTALLINGSAIRIASNHLKTIIRDRLRSTVKGGPLNRRSEPKSNRIQGARDASGNYPHASRAAISRSVTI